MSGGSVSRDPYYHDQADPVTSDKRDRVVLSGTLRRLVLLLDTARNDAPFRVPGDFLFADRNSTGICTLKLNSSGEPPMPFAAMDAVFGLPIGDIHVSHAAQAGLVLNLWYGYRARFTANSQTITSIGSIANQSVSVIGGVNAQNVTDRGFTYGAAFSSSVALAASTAELVFAAASNTNGAIVWEADSFSASTVATFTAISLNARTTVPAAFVDGDVLLINASDSATGAGELGKQVSQNRAKLIAAGKGLWWFNSGGAEVIARRRVLYTLLP